MRTASIPSDQWKGVRTRLAFRSVLDPFRWGFGAAVHRYRLNPVLTEPELAAFEAEHRVVLPGDYRSFLAEVGNGGAGPAYGLLPLESACWRASSMGDGGLAAPFPLTETWGSSEEECSDEAIPDRDGCLVLSELGCGYSALLVVTGPAAGSVWYDFLAGDGGLQRTTHGFASWYWAWLLGGSPNPV